MAVASPCIKVCVLDADRRCIGCGRTIDEIARWLGYSDEQRATIMADLPRRLAERSHEPVNGEA